MSFLSEKDLRKVTNRRVNPTAVSSTNERSKSNLAANLHDGTTTNSVDVIERAKIDREQRQLSRQHASTALTIQRWWRGRNIANSTLRRVMEDYDKKLTDTTKIAFALTSKGIKFVPPPILCVQMTRTWLFLFYRTTCKESITRAFRLVDLFLEPGFSAEAGKNAVTAFLQTQNQNLLISFEKALFYLISPANLKLVPAPTMTRLLNFLNLLLFPPVSEINDIHALLGGTVALLNQTINWFFKLSTIFIPLQSSVAIPGWEFDQSDAMFALLLKLQEVANGLNALGQIHEAPCLLTIPLLTSVVSKHSKKQLVASNMFFSFLSSGKNFINLPPVVTDVPGITAGHWLLGNITSLGLLVQDENKNELTICYLRACKVLMSLYQLPLLFTGRSATLWTKQGASMTAAVIPHKLQNQIIYEGIFNPDFTRELCQKYLVLLPDTVDKNYRADEEEVTAVLNKKIKSIDIAQTAVKDQAESSVLFTSKWAQTLLRGIQPKFKMTATPSFRNTPQPPASNEEKISDVDCEILGVLLELWGKLLPLAALSLSDSAPWRALSTIAFTANSLNGLFNALKIILQNRNLSIDEFSSKFNPAIDVFDGSNLFTAFSALSCLVAVAKVALITADDDDIYQNGVPIRLVSFLPIIRTCKQILIKIVKTHHEVINDPFSSSSPTVAATSATVHGPSSLESNKLSVLSMFSSWFSGNDLHVESIQTQEKRDAETINSQSAPITTSTGNCNLDSLILYSSVRCLSAMLTDLHSRWTRRPFTRDHTIWENIGSDEVSMSQLRDYNNPAIFGVLRVMPWSIPFVDRLKLLRWFINRERTSIQGPGTGDLISQAFQQTRSKGTIVRIRRSNIIMDGMTAFARLRSDTNTSESSAGSIKDRIVVRYIDDRGEEEKGIDLGGLFKDFLTEISQKIFDPSYGLFAVTEVDGYIFPNPAASSLFGDETYAIYRFVGQVLGKAIYEDITIQPQFAQFFLAFMHGKYSFLHLLDDLKSLDSELYKNLRFLKSYEGDVTDLCLTFSITDNSFGHPREVELFAGGSKVEVTGANKKRYIDEVAKYYLHDRIKLPAQAFFSGLYQVIQSDLLSIFSAPELQIVISGIGGGIDVDDLRRNTRYAGGYIPMDTQTSRFWTIVAELDDADKAKLLRFVTSCERSPSLGFSALQPPFTIQRVDCTDDSRLPSASTCFNILKLPTYSSRNIMKEKLLTAIRSNAGFDLS